MKKLVLLSLAAIFAFNLQAQDGTPDPNAEGWDKGIALGASFDQLFLINPRIGSGDDKIALGGNLGIFANYKKGRTQWTNGAAWLLGVQRIGDKDQPFQKNLDQLRLNSNYSYLLKEGSKWGYAADLQFASQILPTYPGNTLIDTSAVQSSVISKFLAPATVQFSPGISYVPNKKLSVLFSPLGVKALIVADDFLASQVNSDSTKSYLGNPFDKAKFLAGDKDYYKKVDWQMGGSIIVSYTNKFLKDRIGYTSRLVLFSNYLRDPQFVDVEWYNSIDLFIIKGLSINVQANLLYDHDMSVITDKKTKKTGDAPTFIEQLSIKYSILF